MKWSEVSNKKVASFEHPLAAFNCSGGTLLSDQANVGKEKRKKTKETKGKGRRERERERETERERVGEFYRHLKKWFQWKKCVP